MKYYKIEIFAIDIVKKEKYSFTKMYVKASEILDIIEYYTQPMYDYSVEILSEDIKENLNAELPILTFER